jgi:hypothetical protein
LLGATLELLEELYNTWNYNEFVLGFNVSTFGSGTVQDIVRAQHYVKSAVVSVAVCLQV